MKYTLALLLLGAPSILWAGPIHRCVDHQGQLSFQSNPCPDIEEKVAVLESGDRQEPSNGHVPILSGSPQEGHAERDKGDKTNQSLCLDALRVARMCGRFAGMFSCGRHGFQREEPSAKNSVDLLRAVRDGGDFTMQECVQQLSE